jgi:hypothetical protein
LRADDLRRRREEQQVEIRRQKREENISKRRNLAIADGPESDDEGSNLVCTLYCPMYFAPSHAREAAVRHFQTRRTIRGY